MSSEQRAEALEKETCRLESFSDGVFAVAIDPIHNRRYEGQDSYTSAIAMSTSEENGEKLRECRKIWPHSPFHLTEERS